MALSSILQWNIQTDGNDANGGAFLRTGTGTNYSLQAAAQVAFTDLVIDGATNTKVTSAANPFSAASVGNVINVTGGTGFTTGRYYVVSVAAAVATLDRAVGTVSSTGGTGNLGGAMLTIAATVTATAGASYFQSVFIKAGTYTLTAVVNLTSGKELAFYGYGTTPMDGGTRPLITTATDSTALFTSSGSNTRALFSNINFSNTAITRAAGITSNQGFIHVSDAIFDGFSYGVDAVVSSPAENVTLTNCELKNCTVNGVRATANGSYAYHLILSGCDIHDNTSYGVSIASACALFVDNSIISDNGNHGIYVTTDQNFVSVIGSTIANNTADGIHFTSGTRRTIRLQNNIIYGNGGYGIQHIWSNVNSPYPPVLFSYNAYGSNTSGNNSDSTMGTGLSPITLTADPFTNAATGDYSLNNTAGGGAACRGAGYQQA